MIEIDYEQRDRIGKLGDKADNFLAAAQIPGIPDQLHVRALREGMEELRDELNAWYLETGGDP